MMTVDPPLPTRCDPPHSWRLTIAPALPWLTENRRGSWQRHHRLVRDWRLAAAWTARSARVPRLDAAHVVVELRFGVRRVRDPANWAPTGKAIVDGLVDAGVLPDDRAEYLTGPDMRHGPPAPRPTVVVHIFARQRL